MTSIRIYTIAYLPEHFDNLEEGYLALDNRANARADWMEYWPVRQLLLSTELDADTYYGFFSPRFKEKTGLSSAAVLDFIRKAPVESDVITFSPQVDIGAFFQNVFVGGELADPGFLETSQQCADAAGLSIDLRTLFMDSRCTVFSNYFVAKPAFWRKWLQVCESFFAIAEGPETPLQKALLHQTAYREGVHRKVFVVEGIVSLLLAINPAIQVCTYNPFKLGWSTQLSRFNNEAVICDALKTAVRENRHEEYVLAYHAMADKVINQVFKRTPEKPPLMKQTPAHDLYNETILEMIPNPCNRVVEVGCMRGTLTRAYLARNASCQWTGIDIDPENAAIAAAVCYKTLCRDIETMDEAEFASVANADAWIFGDTLEHLRDPWAVLSRIRRYLPSEGVVIASIPNAQHWSFQARVNAGQFRYEDEGLFDRTHLRFFTRTTIFEMFEKAGYQVESAVSRIIHSPDAAKYMAPIRAMAQASGIDPDVAEQDAMAFQYVVRAKIR